MYTPKGKKIRVPKEVAATESLISKATGLPYTGDYIYNAQDKTYTDPSGTIELENTFQDESISQDEVNLIPTQYDNIIKQERIYNLRSTRKVPSYLPSPTAQDYVNKVLDRFFAQHKQTGEIIEISFKVFQELSTKSTTYHYPSYIVGSTRWYLVGPVANQNINGYIVEGAAEINSNYIAELERTLPNIRTYLTDPSQFVK